MIAPCKPLRSRPRRSPTVAPERGSLVQRAAELKAQRIAFIPHKSFRSEQSAAAIETDPVVQTTLAETIAAGFKPSRALPFHLTPLCETRLLSAEQEFALFRSLNYHKFHAAQLQRRLDLDAPERGLIEGLEHALAVAARIRDRLIRANLRLVVSIVKKFSDARHALDEQVSEGTMSLIQAVEKFDFDRGFRFSTYATRAIRRNLFRKLMQNNREAARYEPQAPEMIEEFSLHPGSPAQEERRVTEIQGEIGRMLERLDAREQFILRARYGFGLVADRRTLQELSGEMGICKERVRQLELRALEKLRRLADEHRLQRFDD